MFNHKLPTEFPMQTLRKKTSPCKYKNEPGRFLGEGVSFRAKLIGVLEVPEARGDRMCQEALADLKMAIRAAGEHKQRIQVHVAIDGLRLRDDKTGDSLYHHPVHKISFIAQDMTDSRAFGYIFGSPDTGHRFFGIKTDKAASQVVIAMRDLFQVVFELKKKEVELAKQQLEGKTLSSSLVRHTSTLAEPKIKSIPSIGESSSAQSKVEAEGGVAELVDLEQELSSLRRGLTQVEGLTPSTDPFGDSFIPPSASHSTKGLLPPPPSGSSSRGRNTPSSRVFSPNKGSALASGSAAALPFDLTTVPTDFEPPTQSQHSHSQPTSLVDNTLADSHSVQAGSGAGPSTSLSYDVFTELDPLGTGRSKPYVDKKLFFQELKNPPKKVLKDLVPTTTATHTQSLLSEILPESTHSKTEQYGPTTTMTSLSRHSGGTVSIAKPSYGGTFFSTDPFAETDPFDNTDPFSESFKDDPFTTMSEFPKSILRVDDLKSKLSRDISLDKEKAESGLGVNDTGSIVVKNVFNGPLQVTLPPEPVPKSPRLQRQNTDTSTIRQRPQPSSKLSCENASPPPPLPPKKVGEVCLSRPPPRPPVDHEPDDATDVGPPLPRPARKKEPMADRSTKPQPRVRLSSASASAATNSSEEEYQYLPPAPPPLPSPKRFDITLSQLLVATMPELAARLRVPEATLSSMTLPQLTEYLRSYLAADNDKKHVHVEGAKKPDTDFPKPPLYTNKAPPIPSIPHLEKPINKPPPISDFKPQFEDDFTPPASADAFVANFEDFDKKANPSYDRYAAFREIQEQELKSKSILDPLDSSPSKEALKQDSEEKEVAAINHLIINNNQEKEENKETSKSPLKSLDELTLDSFNMFRNSVSPKPTQPIDAKIEDIKSVMKTLQVDNKSIGRRSVSPRENNIESKHDDASDRYAALREITITEPSQDEFESLPPEGPKERKRSDEKSDGFDNSDFFDCIDNSSLSFSHVEEAFRKSPSVKEKEEVKVVEEKKEIVIEPLRDVREAPRARMSTGSVSDVASGSSPDTKEKCVVMGGRWAVLGPAGAGGGTGAGASPSPWSSASDSRESEPRARRHPHPRPHRVHPHSHPHHHHVRTPHSPSARPSARVTVQTSSSSRDVSPWDEEPPPVPVGRLQRPPSHRDRDSRHGSSGSRECLDSGSGREKDKRDKRDSRDREIRISDSGREHRDSGSGRDRRDSKERDHREHRDRRDRRSRDKERENDTWDRDRSYSREREYSSRSRERKEYRDRHRKPTRHCYGEEDYSDGCGSGRSSPRERWPDQRWRRDDRNYGSLGWRDSRRRNELRPSEEPTDRRYGSTLNWPSRRSGSRRDSDRDRDRDSRDRPDPRDRIERDSRDRDPRRRSRREQDRDPRRPRTDYRFPNDFTGREPREPRESHPSPFDNEFVETPISNTKKRAPYSSLEGTRFSFEPEEATATASPVSACSARARDGDADSGTPSAGGGPGIGGPRFRFDSDSLSPRSMFEDDFTNVSTPRGRTASIAEEDESDVPPLRKPHNPQLQHTSRDIKKSESVNIFTRESDPFEGDAFFACTGSDRAARRDNWPGDFGG